MWTDVQSDRHDAVNNRFSKFYEPRLKLVKWAESFRLPKPRRRTNCCLYITPQGVVFQIEYASSGSGAVPCGRTDG
jgi:hypothetical protein